MDLEAIQQALQSEHLDGWLFYDFRKSNPIAYQVLGLPFDAFYSRRWFYFIPAQGEPDGSCERGGVARAGRVAGSTPGFPHVAGDAGPPAARCCGRIQRIAMEYSPMNAIPYMSRVDAGTLELVRSFGVEVVSSANLAQRFGAQLSEAQMESHREAGQTPHRRQRYALRRPGRRSALRRVPRRICCDAALCCTHQTGGVGLIFGRSARGHQRQCQQSPLRAEQRQ